VTVVIVAMCLGFRTRVYWDCYNISANTIMHAFVVFSLEPDLREQPFPAAGAECPAAGL